MQQRLFFMHHHLYGAWLMTSGSEDRVLQRPLSSVDCLRGLKTATRCWRRPTADPSSASPSEEPRTQVVYRGPFAQVTDDSGQVYPRGERVAVDGSTAARLRLGPSADQFSFLRGTEPKP